MAERGYFKSLLLRKSIDAVDVSVPLIAGSLCVLLIVALRMLGLIGRFGTWDNDPSFWGALRVGAVFSSMFFFASGFALLNAFGSSWRGIVDILLSRETATRVSLELAISTSSRPKNIIRLMFRRYAALSVVAVIATVGSAVILSAIIRQDKFEARMSGLLGFGTSLLFFGLARHIYVRWLEHDLDGGHL